MTGCSPGGYPFTPVSLLIGICGGSGSGKTTLAEDVASHFDAVLLPFDAYYRDHGHLTPTERAEVNYDHPDALDVQLFVEHLLLLRGGHEIAMPVYDFATHTRTDDLVMIEPTPVIVVEGILLFSFPEIRELFSLKVFRDCPERLRFERRLERDVAERGRTPESVRTQFAATVAPMHDQFVQPYRDLAEIISDGDDMPLVVDIVCEQVGRLVSGVNR